MYIDTNDYVDASEAAKILGIKRARISQLCNDGRFPGQVKIGHFWLIPRAEVEEFQRLKPGKKKIELQESKPSKTMTEDERTQKLASLLSSSNNYDNDYLYPGIPF